MANYPYISSQGALVKAIAQFKKSFPATVDASTLKRFGIAPANESYAITTLRFLGLIDEDGKRDEKAVAFFYASDDGFKAGLSAVVETAYGDLFSEYGPEVWTLNKDRLSTWFRSSDKTSDVIGSRQAATFQTLAALAGHGDVPKAATTSAGTTSAKPPSKQADKKASSAAKKHDVDKDANETVGSNTDVGLTVRVEVNLPANGTPEVYDAIFASIRKNLIDR